MGHLRDFVCNNISGKKICVVIRCDVLQQLNAGIGSPQNVSNPNTSQNRPPPAQNQQAFNQRNFQQNNNQNNNYGRNNNGNNQWNQNQNNSNYGSGSNQSNIQP